MSFHPLAARLVEWVLRRFGLVYGAQGYRARTLKRLDLALILDRALSFSLSLGLDTVLYCIAGTCALRTHCRNTTQWLTSMKPACLSLAAVSARSQGQEPGIHPATR